MDRSSRTFLAAVPGYRARLAERRQDGNDIAFRALDELLDRADAATL